MDMAAIKATTHQVLPSQTCIGSDCVLDGIQKWAQKPFHSLVTRTTLIAVCQPKRSISQAPCDRHICAYTLYQCVCTCYLAVYLRWPFLPFKSNGIEDTEMVDERRRENKEGQSKGNQPWERHHPRTCGELCSVLMHTHRMFPDEDATAVVTLDTSQPMRNAVTWRRRRTSTQEGCRAHP